MTSARKLILVEHAPPEAVPGGERHDVAPVGSEPHTRLMRQSTPVLAYSSGDAPLGGHVRWWQHGDGRCELVVPPPSLWRLLLGPALAVVFLTPLLAFAVGWMLISFTESVVAGGWALLVVAAGFGAWGGAMAQLVGAARHGRSPFAITGDASGFELVDPRGNAVPAQAARARHVGRVAYVRLFTLHRGMCYDTARLVMSVEGGGTICADAPCEPHQHLKPAEAWLEGVFGTVPACAPWEDTCVS